MDTLCNYSNCRNVGEFSNKQGFCDECTHKPFKSSYKKKGRILSDSKRAIYMRNLYQKDSLSRYKSMARARFRQAVKDGKIERQVCEIEGCNTTGEGHHEDYTKPFEVKWLCKYHHEKYHINLIVKV